MLILSTITACDDSASATSNGSTSLEKIQTSSSAEDSSIGESHSSSTDSSATLESSAQVSQEINSSSTVNTGTAAEHEIFLSSSSATDASGFSKDAEIKVSSSSKNESIPAQATLDENGFATIADVYRSLAPSEKAVFVIRHSEREDAVTIETELTANGIKMAEDLGATLKSDEDFSYITSGFVRTNETANHIAAGRGTPSPKLITNYDITGNWFLKISADELATYADNLGMKGSSIELMSHWAYGEDYPDALYDLEPRAKEFMETVILKNLPKWNRVSIMVSHDIFVMPLTVYSSQKQVALKYYEDYHWINYIAGLAIIVNENNELRYVPVKGADSGVIDYLAIYMAEHNMKF